MTPAEQRSWDERIGILNSVGVGMPARAELAGLDVDPDLLRVTVRAAYGQGLRGAGIVEVVRAMADDHGSTSAGLGVPVGEVDIAPDDAEPNDLEMTDRNGEKGTKEMRIAAITGTTPAVNGKPSLKVEDHSHPVATADLTLLTVGDVARLLKLSQRQVWKLAKAKRLPAPLRLGRSVRWRVTDLVRFLEAGADPAKYDGPLA